MVAPGSRLLPPCVSTIDNTVLVTITDSPPTTYVPTARACALPAPTTATAILFPPAIAGDDAADNEVPGGEPAAPGVSDATSRRTEPVLPLASALGVLLTT